MTRHRPSLYSVATLTCLFALAAAVRGDELTVVGDVPEQAFEAQVKRVVAALDFVGAPLTKEQATAVEKAIEGKDSPAALQKLLDPLCMVEVTVNAESRVRVAAGPAAKKLVQNGWTVFLVKVVNEGGVTATLACKSPNAAPLYQRSSGSPDPKPSVKESDVPHRWLDVSMLDKQPLNARLSGLLVEYRIVELYARSAGKHEAKLAFDVGQGTQDLGFRNEANILFDVAAGVDVTLNVIDDDGTPTTGQFVFRDPRGRVYPSRSRRLAPDFFFHDQIYRHDGESISLPSGQYEVEFTRGPEYIIQRRTLVVGDKPQQKETFRLKRWIKLANYGWFSGDHHVHAAGCAHYEAPAQGVQPEDMMRHILGEDLNVGCVLSWGPCWYHQKQFFEGHVNKLSTPRYLMRYDVEVSGFPSSHAGHLCLLRLTEDDYPGTTRHDEWPSWDQPILAWGKSQGGVVGFSHSGWGLQVPGDQLPNYNMPKFDGIGANEYIVNVTHDVCDFISAVDTPSVWELNIWYHTLNCGYTCRISGETDFPCIYGDRVGLGRAYVKLDKEGPLDFDAWVQGIKDGRSYCCDGLAHLPDFKVNDLGVGEKGDGGRPSVLAVKSGEKLKITARVAGMLAEKPREDIRKRPLDQKPYWHIERARVSDSRRVLVELIVNGKSVETKEIDADGMLRDVAFDYTPEKSSWVALRIFPAAHTNPVFVEVDGQPIRASKKSAKWCQDAVDVCWNSKQGAIRQGKERQEARAAYDAARAAYAKIIEESADD
ncbi:MAG: CehA/McbA family metallohydrolase [Pirellulales bacterium]